MMGLQICLVLTWCIWFNQKGEEEETIADKPSGDPPSSSHQFISRPAESSEFLIGL
jgi:hypothetical protein